MKLSELTTDQAIDVMIQITPYIANIVGDKNLLDTLKENAKGNTLAEMYASGAKKITLLVPILLKDHKSDVFGLLAVLNNSTPEEITTHNILKTIKQIKEAIQDKDLRDFFKSLQQESETE